MSNNVLNITNGEYFNEYFATELGGKAVAFNENMMDGKATSDIYSESFIQLRSRELGVECDEYRKKMQAYEALQDDYREIRLWFGRDTFCQVNLLTLLAYLEQIGYGGTLVLNYIDDESFEVLEKNIRVELGIYKELYKEILIEKRLPQALGVLDERGIALYFDYHSSDGVLARLARDNSFMDERGLCCLLLENSKEYGLSEEQAKKIITANT